MRIGQKSKTLKCPYCKKKLRYRGKDEDGKQIFSCKRPYTYTKREVKNMTMVDRMYASRKDLIGVGYCNYEIRI
jgi:hypothetical protein